MSKVLKIGDKVWWRGGFGSEPAKLAVVEGIEITGGHKYGDSVEEVPWSEVYDRNVTVDLDSEHWAYADQISRCLQD
tara:strand:- start:667 stop:897 length:231 start_codon:yes stop_codon:yes gene_type:complete